MKKPIIGFVQAPNYDNKVVVVKAQISKPKKNREELLLNKKLFIGLDGTVVDRDSYKDWERDKYNASWE
jgi:hypothetical protein